MSLFSKRGVCAFSLNQELIDDRYDWYTWLIANSRSHPLHLTRVTLFPHVEMKSVDSPFPSTCASYRESLLNICDCHAGCFQGADGVA